MSSLTSHPITNTPPVPPPRTSPSQPLTTDLLIIGAGPAGASLACFLARHNLTGLTLSAAPGTSPEPRAHLTNSAALECLRDLDGDVHAECERLGNGADFIKNYRWCETLAGDEYARVPAWGTHGARGSDFETASPCRYMDLPQSLLEPVLVKWATSRGWRVRWDTRVVGVREGGGEGGEKRWRVKVVDQITGGEYEILTRFLFGADGGRSLVAKELGLPFQSAQAGAPACNVLVKADLAHLMQYREGNLHMLPRLEKDYPFVCVARMVKPWTEWMFVAVGKGPGVVVPEYTPQEWADIISDFIGDPSVAVSVLHNSRWIVNETSADVISKGTAFCLGDAIHRHPPTLGLGSNTGIQDAFNLAWKIALVMKGQASPSLLATYNTERQPVASKLVRDSNDTLRSHLTCWFSLGVQPPGTPAAVRQTAKDLLKQATPEGREARARFHASIRNMQTETQALGTALNQLYASSAVVSSDEVSPFQPGPRETADPYRFHDPSTYPGRRLPHVWLGKRLPGKMVSTLDIAGKGRFTLLTGIGGEGWLRAAETVTSRLGVELKGVGIGVGLEWEDVYLDWEEKAGVEEDGCVLVRPDLFVAWRAERSGDEVGRLLEVMRGILGVGGADDEAENGVGNGVC